MHRGALARLGRALSVSLVTAALAGLGCDEPSGKITPATVEAAPPEPTPALPPTAAAPPKAPDIILDPSTIAIGRDRVPLGELGLADKVGVFLRGAPGVEGATVSVVAMRGTKPSAVAAVAQALHKAKAAGAVIKSEARDGTTQVVPVSFPATVQDCTTVAWIAKDASIEVWPAGGGTAHRIIKGLAGPDMTLGTEAMRKQWSSCNASELVVGADDVLTWGLVFDLATSALQASGTHVTTTVLVTTASAGKKVAVE